MLPDWLPNVHPLIVHFPIALLVTAVLFDMLVSFSKSLEAVRRLPVVLYVLGSVSAVIAFFTGRHASDHVDLPTAAIGAVTDHSDLALYTVLGFGIYTLVRIFVTYRVPKIGGALKTILVLIPLAGIGLLALTADKGAMLVYKYGVGVGSSSDPEMHEHDDAVDVQSSTDAATDAVTGLVSAISYNSDGSWSWTPGEGAHHVFDNSFQLLLGNAENLEIASTDSGATINLNGGAVLLSTRDSLANIEVTAEVDPRDFQGTLRLVHNVVDSGTYDFVELGNGSVAQGRMQSSTRSMFGSSGADLSQPASLRSISNGTHFRAYINGTQAAHGHGDAALPGGIGLYLEGVGSVRLINLSVTRID